MVRAIEQSEVVQLEDLPNVGKAIAGDLRLLGVEKPTDLCGRNPVELYEALNLKTGERHDPCVLDVFMSVVDFMDGAPARDWWYYTPIRKKLITPRY